MSIEETNIRELRSSTIMMKSLRNIRKKSTLINTEAIIMLEDMDPVVIMEDAPQTVDLTIIKDPTNAKESTSTSTNRSTSLHLLLSKITEALSTTTIRSQLKKRGHKSTKISHFLIPISIFLRLKKPH